MEQLRSYVTHVVDDAGGQHPTSEVPSGAVLVAWQCGFEPLVVAVFSYLPDCSVSFGEAEELATDLLAELGWFAGEVTQPDYLVRYGFDETGDPEPCRFHDFDHESCETYSGQVPCEVAHWPGVRA